MVTMQNPYIAFGFTAITTSPLGLDMWNFIWRQIINISPSSVSSTFYILTTINKVWVWNFYSAVWICTTGNHTIINLYFLLSSPYRLNNLKESGHTFFPELDVWWWRWEMQQLIQFTCIRAVSSSYTVIPMVLSHKQSNMLFLFGDYIQFLCPKLSFLVGC